MPIPLQTLITLPLYDRPYTYFKQNIRRNEKNVKAAAEEKQTPPRCKKILLSN
jgi:hypothetical protein